MAKSAAWIRNVIRSNKVVIFSKSHCPHCQMAKDIFKKLDQKFATVELDYRLDGDELLKSLAKLTGAKTVPRVFVNGEFVGGANDVRKLYQSGRLTEYLEQED